MAFEAQPPLRTAAKMIFEHGPGIRIVAGHARHRQTVARVRRLLAEGVGKGHMFGMATGTDLTRFVLQQHRPAIGAVSVMTAAAGFPTGVAMKSRLPPGKSVGMTSPTDLPFPFRQHPGAVPGMGIVATGAEVRLPVAPQMVDSTGKRLQLFWMAFQTRFGPIGLAVAGGALTGVERLVADVP